MGKLVAAMLVITAVLGSATAYGQNYNFLVVGDPGTSGKAFATAIDKAVKASLPGSATSYEQKTGAVAIIETVQKNPKAIGIVDVVSVKLAIAGSAPFKAPASDVVAVGSLHDKIPFLAITSREFLAKNVGVNFDEIYRRKLPIRVGLAEAGTVDQVAELAVLAEVKSDPATIKGAGGSVVYGKKEELLAQIKAKKLDMAILLLPLGDPRVVELFKSNQFLLSSPSDPTIRNAAAKLGTTRLLVPGDVFPFQGPMHTIANGLMLIVNKKMPEKEAYEFAKALATNLKDLQAATDLNKDLTGAALAGNRGATLHLGAEKFYREAGLLK